MVAVGLSGGGGSVSGRTGKAWPGRPRHQVNTRSGSTKGSGGRGDSPRPPVECRRLVGVHRVTPGQRPRCGPRRPGRTWVPSALTAVSLAGLSPKTDRIVGATWVVSTEVDST